MGIVDNILVPTAALGGFGAAIDFYLGTPGQKRVKTWLEEKWYRFHDVNWHNFSEKEARYFIELFDRLFGASLFSVKRLVVCLVLPAVSIAFGVIWCLWHGPFIDEIFPISKTDLVVVIAAFALSLSFTRWLSLKIIQWSRYDLVRPWLIPLLFVFHLVLFLIWRPILAHVIFNFQLVATYAVAAFDIGEFQLLFAPFFNGELRSFRIMMRSLEGAFEIHRISSIFHIPTFDPVSSGMIFNETVHSVLANGLRLLFASILLLSLLFRVWFGPVFSLTWARLVETEKPIFTMTLGGVGAMATTLKELVKLL